MKRTTAPNSVGGLYVDDTGIGDGTAISADDKNITQEEIVNVAEMTGNALTGADDEQMKTAILETAGKLYSYNTNSIFTLENYDKKPTIILQAGITILTLNAGTSSPDEAQRILIVNISGGSVNIQGDLYSNIDINNGSILEFFYESSAGKFIVVENDVNGSGAPAIKPSFVGQKYIDIAGNRQYFAVGVSASTDWRKIAKYKYGTVTITAGGGDVTINLDFDWTDGILFLYISTLATDYLAPSAVVKLESSYDSLTNAAYTSNHLMNHDTTAASPHLVAAKTVNVAGIPKSATSNSFTLNDDGLTTVYVKYQIIA